MVALLKLSSTSALKSNCFLLPSFFHFLFVLSLICCIKASFDSVCCCKISLWNRAQDSLNVRFSSIVEAWNTCKSWSGVAIGCSPVWPSIVCWNAVVFRKIMSAHRCADGSCLPSTALNILSFHTFLLPRSRVIAALIENFISIHPIQANRIKMFMKMKVQFGNNLTNCTINDSTSVGTFSRDIWYHHQFWHQRISSLQTARHNETEECFPSKLHPFLGLYPHDADVTELPQSWHHLCLGTRLFLDSCRLH